MTSLHSSRTDGGAAINAAAAPGHRDGTGAAGTKAGDELEICCSPNRACVVACGSMPAGIEMILRVHRVVRAALGGAAPGAAGINTMARQAGARWSSDHQLPGEFTVLRNECTTALRWTGIEWARHRGKRLHGGPAIIRNHVDLRCCETNVRQH